MSTMRGWAVLAVVLWALVGCATQVARVGADEVHDLSGRWNDTDSRLVSEAMIEEMLSRPWIDQHLRNNRGERPTVLVGEVRNLGHEHINTRTFVNDIERAALNSGRVRFVATAAEREAIRDERAEQDLHAREDTRKPMGQELGADYLLTGTVNTIVDVEGRNEVAYYQIDLALTSLADNSRVWVGQKRIKKVIQRARFRS